MKIHIEKNNKKITYFIVNKNGCLASFSDKKTLKNYIKENSLNITKINHINYNLYNNKIPLF